VTHSVLSCVRKIAKSDLASSCLSVRPSEWNNSALTGRVFMKFGVWGFFETVEKLKFHWNMTRIGYFTWRPMYIYDNISLNSSYNEKCVRQRLWRKSKHTLCSITFFRKSCRLWDNVEKYRTDRQATDENMIRHARFACRITKARIQTRTHNI
jgi:hypothetical protein